MQFSKMALSDYLNSVLNEVEGNGTENVVSQAPADDDKNKQDKPEQQEEPTMENVKAYFKEHQDKIDKFIELCVNSEKAKELNLTADDFKKVIKMSESELESYLEKMSKAATETIEKYFEENDYKEFDDEAKCKKLAEELHSKNEKIDTDLLFATINGFIEDKKNSEEESTEEKNYSEDEKKALEKAKELAEPDDIETLKPDDKEALKDLLVKDEKIPEETAKKVLDLEAFHKEMVAELLKEIYG